MKLTCKISDACITISWIIQIHTFDATDETYTVNLSTYSTKINVNHMFMKHLPMFIKDRKAEPTLL